MDVALIILSVFAGVAAIRAVSGWTATEQLRAQRGIESAPNRAAENDPVLAELRALKQQIASMQDTSHQFDLSFDEALTRLEQRVARLETKSAAAPAVTGETPNVLRNEQTL